MIMKKQFWYNLLHLKLFFYILLIFSLEPLISSNLTLEIKENLIPKNYLRKKKDIHYILGEGDRLIISFSDSEILSEESKYYNWCGGYN